MKKYLWLMLSLALIGTAPSNAEDLLGGETHWPTTPRGYESHVDNEISYTAGGAAAGAAIASMASDDDTVVAGVALFSAFIGNRMGANKDRKLAAAQALVKKDNCRVVTIYKTNYRNGQSEAQQEMVCDEMLRREVPLAEMVAPGAMSYKHDGTDPATLLSEKEQQAVIEFRKRQAAEEELSDDERAVLELYRNNKGATPAPQENSGSAEATAYATRVSYKPGCKLYVNGVMNPDC